MSTMLYKNYPTVVEELTRDVISGRIGLPDLQRPFVWKDNKVRNLLDSMIKGYPIGYIMLWQSPDDYESKKTNIGINSKTFDTPLFLVIDGQQRLTALVASLYGIKIKDKDYNEREIKISFNPLTKAFEVWTSAYDRTPEWIPRISDLFIVKRENQLSAFRRNYIRNLNESRQKKGNELLTDEEKDLIEENLNEVLNLSQYALPTLEISREANEEDVAEVFVRVNSGATALNENNFIQTIISVYENDTSARMDKFCKESRVPAKGTSYNTIIELDTSHIVKMTVGVGFRKARLKYVYMLLRGKNLQTGEYSSEEQQTNLSAFKNALDKVLDLNNWHLFLNILGEAGYIDKSLITSKNAVVFSYVLFLIGKYDYKIEALHLKELIAKWFFVTSVTGYYTGSPESTMEKLFADIKNVFDADGFERYLDSVINTLFTDDFFDVTLPNDLNTASANSPSWNAFVASQILMGTPMLFSQSPLGKFFIPGSSGSKNSIDKHHIFPKNYLTNIGIDQDRERNQIANFTYLDYETNITISDRPPYEYVPEFKEKLGNEKFEKACYNNALPEGFENMEYNEFLSLRRSLMAKIIKKAFNILNHSDK